MGPGSFSPWTIRFETKQPLSTFWYDVSRSVRTSYSAFDVFPPFLLSFETIFPSPRYASHFPSPFLFSSADQIISISKYFFLFLCQISLSLSLSFFFSSTGQIFSFSGKFPSFSFLVLLFPLPTRHFSSPSWSWLLSHDYKTGPDQTIHKDQESKQKVRIKIKDQSRGPFLASLAFFYYLSCLVTITIHTHCVFHNVCPNHLILFLD